MHRSHGLSASLAIVGLLLGCEASSDAPHYTVRDAAADATLGDPGQMSGTADASASPGARDGGGDAAVQATDASADSGVASPDGGDSGSSRDACPYTLTALTPPTTQTADMALAFSVVNSEREGVTGLRTEHFLALEDGRAVDRLESRFEVTPLEGAALDMPTILLLDLSASIVDGGALEDLKVAASAIVDAMVPEQRLAIVTFADEASVRVPLTDDQALLKDAIDALDAADGLTTNLNGALIESFRMWRDGYVGGRSSSLAAGLAIVVTDGADRAGVNTLDDVIAARGSRRVIAVGIGSGVDADALSAIGNAGVVEVTSYAALQNDIERITGPMRTLAKSNYSARYCSPARAGSHKLAFTAKCNEHLLPAVQEPACKATNILDALPQGFEAFPLQSLGSLSEALCREPGIRKTACVEASGAMICCPIEKPFACRVNSSCYQTAEEANAACGSNCLACESSVTMPGLAIAVSFDASGYSSKQCPATWGTECKGLSQCCDGLASSQAAVSCQGALVAAEGDEALCSAGTLQHCPALGPRCLETRACCDEVGSDPYSAELCESALWSAHAAEAMCVDLTAAHCPTSPRCVALQKCCNTIAPELAPNLYPGIPGYDTPENRANATRFWCVQQLHQAKNDDDACEKLLSMPVTLPAGLAAFPPFATLCP